MSARLKCFLANRAREFAWAATFTLLIGPSYVQALAIEELSVRSGLGQPLHAEVMLSLSAGETIRRECVSVQRAPASAGLPPIEGVRLKLSTSAGGSRIELRSPAPVVEPLSELILSVECPGMPTVRRNFLVMLDPPVLADAHARVAARSARPEPIAAAGSGAADFRRNAGVERGPVGSRPAASVARTPDSRRRLLERYSDAPIEPGSEYLVQPGDTLSNVAARIAGRPARSVWQVAAGLMRSNPDAFLTANPDLMEAGALLVIPSLDVLLDNEALPTREARVPVATALPSLIPRPPRSARPTRIAALPSRTQEPQRRLRAFVMSTSLSGDSRRKLEMRAAGHLQANRLAVARVAQLSRRQSLFAAPAESGVPLDGTGTDAFDESLAAEAALAGTTPESVAIETGENAVADGPSSATALATAGSAVGGFASSPLAWLLIVIATLLLGAGLGGWIARRWLQRSFDREMVQRLRAQQERNERSSHATAAMNDGPSSILVDEQRAAASTQEVTIATMLGPDDLMDFDVAPTADDKLDDQADATPEALDETDHYPAAVEQQHGEDATTATTAQMESPAQLLDFELPASPEEAAADDTSRTTAPQMAPDTHLGFPEIALGPDKEDQQSEGSPTERVMSPDASSTSADYSLEDSREVPIDAAFLELVYAEAYEREHSTPGEEPGADDTVETAELADAAERAHALDTAAIANPAEPEIAIDLPPAPADEHALDFEVPTVPKPAAPAAVEQDAFYHIEADALDETMLSFESNDDSKIIELCQKLPESFEEPHADDVEPASSGSASPKR